MNTTVRFLWVAGGVQLALAVANLWVPKVLRYRQNLAKLSPMVRQVFIVHSVYLVLVLLGFSGLCFFFAPQLASGQPLGRSICAFLAFFWLLRVGLQFGYYDRTVRASCRLGDIAYTLAVASLGVVFGVVALNG